VRRLIQAGTVITSDASDSVFSPGWVRIDDDVITAVGPGTATSEPGEELVALPDSIVLPGFVNTHTHLFQTLFRGVYEERPLREYLDYIYRSGLEMQPEDSFSSGCLGALEGLRGGVTTVVDHHFLNRTRELAAETIRGARAVGTRVVLARTVMDIPDGLPAEIVDDLDQAFRDVDHLLDEFAQERRSGFVEIWTGPNTPGMNASDVACIASADYARSHGMRRSAHIAEYKGVVGAVQRRYGRDGVVDWLDDLGVLGPDLLAVHAVQVSQGEVGRLAASGAAISHNPFSNLFCGDRNAPVSDYLAAGMIVGLGTDGAANNNAMGVLDALRITRLLQRLHPHAPDAISPLKALRMATIDGARALGIDDRVGSLEPAKQADIIVVGVGRSAHTTPLHDSVIQLVHSAKLTDVSRVMVAGQWILDDDGPRLIDEREALHDAQQRAVELVCRLG
jgi:5-methylthioadenosine/S-adenosylhomocysteine deaminase